MDGNVHKVAKDILTLANKFSPLFSAAEELKKLGDLEGFAIELENRRDRAQGEFERAQKIKEAKLCDLEDVSAKIVDAEKQYEKNNSVAQEKAAAIIASAQSKAAQITSEANAERISAHGEIVRLKNSIEKLSDEIVEKQKRLEDLEEKVASIKSKLLNF